MVGKDYIPKMFVRSDGRAAVKIEGKIKYCGRGDTPESRAKYDLLVAEWLKDRAYRGLGRTKEGTVAAVAAAFRRAHPEGRATMHGILVALETAHGSEEAAAFGPKKFKRLIEAWGTTLAHQTVQHYAARVRHLFRWAVSEELVPVAVADALRCVKVPPPERGGGHHREPVAPAVWEDVEKTLAAIRRPAFKIMVRLQALTGMRPGEVCRMRPCDVDRSGNAWIYRPAKHKTQWRGKTREIVLGPNARELLDSWLAMQEDPKGYVFRVPGTKRPYQAGSYGKAVSRAAEEAGVPRWAPNRLRHLAATVVRRKFGLDAAQAVLGHSSPHMTLRYAQLGRERAAEAMEEIG